MVVGLVDKGALSLFALRVGKLMRTIGSGSEKLQYDDLGGCDSSKADASEET